MPVDIKLAFKYKKNTYKMIMSDVDAKVKKLFPTVRKSFFILEILCLSYSSITMRCMKFMKFMNFSALQYITAIWYLRYNRFVDSYKEYKRNSE